MSDSSDNDGSGCMFIIGAIIAGIAIGHLYSEAYGGLVIGMSFMVVGAISVRVRRK